MQVGKQSHHGALALGVVQARGLPGPPGAGNGRLHHLPLPRSVMRLWSRGEGGRNGRASPAGTAEGRGPWGETAEEGFEQGRREEAGCGRWRNPSQRHPKFPNGVVLDFCYLFRSRLRLRLRGLKTGPRRHRLRSKPTVNCFITKTGNREKTGNPVVTNAKSVGGAFSTGFPGPVSDREYSRGNSVF